MSARVPSPTMKRTSSFVRSGKPNAFSMAFVVNNLSYTWLMWDYGDRIRSGDYALQLLRPGGGTVWRQDGYVRRGVSTPVIVPDKRLLFGDRFGNLSLLSMNDGQTLARIEIDDSALATPPLLAGDEAYVQTQEGTIAAIALR